jgi:hypothetical protein
MKTPRFVAAAAVFILVACTSSSQKTVLIPAPAKAFPCDLDLFTAASEVLRPHEKVCVINAKGQSNFDDRSDASGRALERARQDACACGADALIIQDSYRDKDNVFRIKFRERMNAMVYAVAIRYTSSR